MTGIMQSFVGGMWSLPYVWPTTIGGAYGGGYFAGQINIGGSIYNLIVAPKSQENSTIAWSTVNVSTGYTSYTTGSVNSAGEAALGANYQAATYCENLVYGGYSDWYLPSVDELLVAYYYLKCNSNPNGTNATTQTSAAVNPMPSTGFTTTNPPVTTASNFLDGASEYFGGADTTYKSSTEYTSNLYLNRVMYPNTLGDGGTMSSNIKGNTSEIVRPFRKVLA